MSEETVVTRAAHPLGRSGAREPESGLDVPSWRKVESDRFTVDGCDALQCRDRGALSPQFLSVLVSLRPGHRVTHETSGRYLAEDGPGYRRRAVSGCHGQFSDASAGLVEAESDIVGAASRAQGRGQVHQVTLPLPWG